MRIAIGGIITKPITPHALGGTEELTRLLVDELVKRGHIVTLYCAKGSQTKAQRHVEICAPGDAMGEESNLHFVYPYTLLEVDRMLTDIKNGEFDIVHINFLKTFLFSYFARDISIPVVYTQHRDFFAHQNIVDIYSRLGMSGNQHQVYVSKYAQKHSLLQSPSHVVHNGIAANEYPFSEGKKNSYLLWLSRVDPLKGTDIAASVAKAAGVPLILSGSIDRRKYQEYFDTKVKPNLGAAITYEEHSSNGRKLQLYQEAKAFLFPMQWEEPFGLVLIEAMACGTPVIAYARGAAPEIIEDGVTGYLVNPSDSDIRGSWSVNKTGEAGLQEAIEKLYSLSEAEYQTMREQSRKKVEAEFSASTMAKNYENVYQEVITRSNR